ncbi:lysozyme inhibitor LprI family protein [Sphingomonas sp. KR3-1]|uniref:lysozyme inhibitor LprI family protein n=1 Tax=Sphingomonas sp. KR3-1 TaxID=3156611 RepID=UPI0032B3B8B8
MLIALALLAAAPDPYAAYETAAFKACDAKATEPIVSAGCAEVEASRQDALLAKEWAAALAKLPVPVRPEASKAETAWRQFRDLDCAVPGKMDLGAGDAAYYVASCRLHRTIERRMGLADYPELNEAAGR